MPQTPGPWTPVGRDGASKEIPSSDIDAKSLFGGRCFEAGWIRGSEDVRSLMQAPGRDNSGVSLCSRVNDGIVDRGASALVSCRLRPQ